MGIYLRSIIEDNGDISDYLWYCSQTCYSDSFAKFTADNANVEKGGAYPCGAEHDSPDYCATCGEPVGNPITDVGEAYVIEYVSDTLLSGADVSTLGMPDDMIEQTHRAYALFNEYGYLFEPYTADAIRARVPAHWR